MIIRIVKMNFQADKTEYFLRTFRQKQSLIASFDGCNGVELLRDIHNPNTFFTYSRWNSPENLDAYRQSALFKETWSTAKLWFSGKAEAWSVEEA